MLSRAVRLVLVSSAAVLGLSAQEAPPQALPVEEPAIEVIPGGNVAPPPAESKALSRSGMFRVSGGEQAQRSSVALLLEQSKDDLETSMSKSRRRRRRRSLIPVARRKPSRCR